MKKLLFGINPINMDIAALALRIIVGALFIYHGATKIASFNEMFDQFPDLIGIGSGATLVLVILAEFGGGILVLTGLITRLAVIPIFITMVVAFFVVHASDPFQAKELALVYMILSVIVFLVGSGKYSIDRLFRA